MSFSLQNALQTCKVNTGWASRIESDRFENANLAVCPTWTGHDLTGRPVSFDSFNTKTRGCSLPNDRIDVENNLRPQYVQYVTLDAAGYDDPELYGVQPGYHESNMGRQAMTEKAVRENIGHYGYSPGNNTIQAGSPIYPSEQTFAEQATYNRMNQNLQEGFKSNQYRRASGFNG